MLSKSRMGDTMSPSISRGHTRPRLQTSKTENRAYYVTAIYWNDGTPPKAEQSEPLLCVDQRKAATISCKTGRELHGLNGPDATHRQTTSSTGRRAESRGQPITWQMDQFLNGHQGLILDDNE
jgi:hypothetical protein